MDLGLKDKVVLCMASAAGLGKGIATEMAREGAKVMICTAEPFKDQLLEAQAEIEKETGAGCVGDSTAARGIPTALRRAGILCAAAQRRNCAVSGGAGSGADRGRGADEDHSFGGRL